MKKQGYLARLKESLGERHKGKHKQSLTSRAHESRGEEKASGKKAYSAVKSMDKGAKGMESHPWSHHSVAKLKKHMDGIHKLIAHKMSKKKGCM